MKLTGTCVLITGASSGIGAATARAAYAKGATVLLVARSPEALEALAADLGDRAFPYTCDIGDVAAVDKLAAAVAADGHRPDVVINNAGAGRWLYVEDTDPEEFLQMTRVPYVGAFLITRAFVPGMLARRHGWIVNVNSPVSLVTWPGALGYAGSRWALRGFDAALAAELRGTGVGVSQVVPGKVASDYFANNPGSEQRIPAIAKLMRTLTPAQVADAICDTIERERRTVLLPSELRVLATASRLFPRMVDWLAWRTGATRDAAPAVHNESTS